MADDLQIEALARKLYPYLAADFLSLRSGYVEGSYTPTYEGATTPGSTTYTTQTGNYKRIGALVICQADIIWTAATGTGVVRLGGLPFTAVQTVSFPAFVTNVTFANGSVQGLLQGGNAKAQLFSPATNAAGTELTVEAAGTIRYLIVYFI